MSATLKRISQGQLNCLEFCPRKFQYLYFEQLHSLPNPQQQEKITWGSQFHLLMQQRELGLPIDDFLGKNEELNKAINALIKATPEIWLPDSEIWREAEHYRTLNFGNYLLVVIYDLLVINNGKAQIFDWKTYLQPENPAKLAQNWQTRLYQYVLAETTELAPEDISLTYWFVKLPHEPQSVTFKYNLSLHEKTKQDLANYFQDLDDWLENYLQNQEDFPQVPASQGKCKHCSFAYRCERTKDSLNWDDFIVDIEEVAI